MKVHFTAIGGSVMHNLAIALKHKGYQVSGSDDEIYEPSRSRLEAEGLLPPAEGWFPEYIDRSVDALILGMHARKDNPELLKAQELGVPVYSYPSYIYQQSINKERVVIAGSHGKTTITAMVIHALQYHERKFDYVVGALLPGLDTTVRLSDDAPVVIIEGDEYFSSPIDPTPKFLHYRHHIGLISGIAWDHINVYPDFDEYVKQFEHFAASSPKAGTIIYCAEDDLATIAASSNKMRDDVVSLTYETHPYKVVNGTTLLRTDTGDVPLAVFGKHNMQNINGARLVCNRLGISDKKFYEAISSFKGASRRLEVIALGKETHVFRDFAHAPSKLKASTAAVKEQFPNRRLVACAELHTYSSLNKDFLPHYKNSMDEADEAIVYYNPKTVAHKKLAPIAPEDIADAFEHPALRVFTDAQALCEYLLSQNWDEANLLLMSSGTFDNTNFQEFSKQLIALA